MKRVWLVLLLALLSGPVLAKGLKPLPPRPVPQLALPALNGDKFDFRQLRGKVVLVNFWATWCPPCRQEMPSMQRLNDKLAGKPFAILGINVGETPAQVNAFLKIVPVDFPIVLDEKGTNLNAWQVFAFPTSYLIDKQGRIRYGLFGSIEWDEPEAVQAIEGLLAEP
ncbi:MAG: TlpA family protein disulfide reductase [Betaproteobacteria bacterium]|nr:TlpA family protein disulfide reductase [Betaproteobacteria bacterium]